MASLLGKLHFWTLKTDALIPNSSIGCHIYHDKGSPPIDQPLYSEELKTYCTERGLAWSPSKKRPEKLRENLKEAEIMLNNGALLLIWMKAGVGDIEKLRIDKYLVGKLHSDHIVKVCICDSSILVSYVEPKLTHIHLGKKLSTGEGGKKWEKLGSLEPKIWTIDLIGPSGRRLERQLSCSIQCDQLMIWWMSSSDEVWPWTPVSTDKERANIHVYSLSSSDVSLLCYLRTKSDPIWASYSRLHLHQFFTIEQQVSRKGEITVDMCVYEVMKNKIQRISVTVIPLGSSVVCHGMNLTEDRILLGCKDGSLVMYDTLRKSTYLTRAGFVPTVVGWHPTGSLVIVGSEKGQIQCYDMALNCLNIEVLSEDPNPARILDLSTYFRFQHTLTKLIWNPVEYGPKNAYGYLDHTHTLLILMNRGPLIALMFTAGVHNKGALRAVELVSEYMKYSQTDEAINLLLSLNWNTESELCFKCLNIITNHLLRLPLTDDREVQLELALGSYYSPAYPLSDVVTLEYDKVVRLARRFFHHLLRYERFEKAFLLAADIGAKDLFMDIHYVASDRAEHTLAQAALDRALQLERDGDSSSVGSQLGDDDSTSRSSTSCSSYCSEDDAYESANVQAGVAQKPDQGNPTAKETKDISRSGLGPNTQAFRGYREAPISLSYEWPSQVTRHHLLASHHQDDWQRYGTQQKIGLPTQQTVGVQCSQRGLLHTTQDISEEVTSEEDEDGHGTVHVVHFGVV